MKLYTINATCEQAKYTKQDDTYQQDAVMLTSPDNSVRFI